MPYNGVVRSREPVQDDGVGRNPGTMRFAERAVHVDAVGHAPDDGGERPTILDSFAKTGTGIGIDEFDRIWRRPRFFARDREWFGTRQERQ